MLIKFAVLTDKIARTVGSTMKLDAIECLHREERVLAGSATLESGMSTYEDSNAISSAGLKPASAILARILVIVSGQIIALSQTGNFVV